MRARGGLAALRRCGLEPMLLRCRKVELLQARGEVLGPAAEAISRETLSAALRAFYSALFQDPAPDLDAIAPDARRGRGAALCARSSRTRTRPSTRRSRPTTRARRLRRDGRRCIRRTDQVLLGVPQGRALRPLGEVLGYQYYTRSYVTLFAGGRFRECSTLSRVRGIRRPHAIAPDGRPRVFVTASRASRARHQARAARVIFAETRRAATATRLLLAV